MKLIEMMVIKDDYRQVALVNVDQITACLPQFKKNSDEWSHTAIWLTGAGYLNVDMSLDQIEAAITKASI